MNRTFDVIVIGGGIIGLTCAWRLSQTGLKVCLLESQYCGKGASSASLGVLAAHSPAYRHPFHELHRKSLSMFKSFAEELNDYTRVDPLYSCNGILEVIPTEEQYQQAIKEVQIANDIGELAGQYQILSFSDLKEIEPKVVGTDFGALYCGSAAQIAIDMLMSALLKACLSTKVQIKEGCTAKGLLWRGQQLIAVQTEHENYACANVLVAAGAWSPEISPLIQRYSALEPIKGQGVSLRSESKLAKHIIKWKRSYIVPQPDLQLVLGSTTEFGVGFDQDNTAAGIHDILHKTIAVLPELMTCKLTRCWAGIRPATADRKPCLGAVPDVNGLYLATGFYKIGYGFAPLVAQALAELISTGRTRFPIDRIPPRDYKI